MGRRGSKQLCSPQRRVVQGGKNISTDTADPKAGGGRREAEGVSPPLDHTPPSRRSDGKQHISDTFSFFCRAYLFARLYMQLFSSHGRRFLLRRRIKKKKIRPIIFTHVFYVRSCVLKIRRYGDDNGQRGWWAVGNGTGTIHAGGR